jgi:drug/metabolite transporter (DMT)-like permease
MSLAIFAVVVLSSVFQAWWNFHLKKTPIDRSAFLLVSWFFFGLIATPVSLFFINKPFQWEWLFFIAATGFAQGMYLLILCWAYSVSDISLVFPVARGASVGFSAVVLSMVGGYSISVLGWIGIATVVVGAMCMGSVDLKTERGRLGLIASLMIAMIITSYSVIDTFGAQEIPIVFYVIVMNLTAPIVAFPFVYRKKRQDVLLAWRHYKREGFLVALAGSAAYLVVIWTFNYASPAYVLALREVSIVFASIMGIHFLKESRPKRKIIGIVLILFGIICIKLA